MSTNQTIPPDAADDTVMQPAEDPEKTQLLGRAAPDSTQLLDEDSVDDAGRRPRIDVNSVLLGRFKLAQLVGEGGMSDVYKAIDLRKVEAGARDPYLAVKVLTVGFDDFFSSLAVMHHEASKLQTLTHPNIVRVFDCDRDGQTVFMTMEYLDGTPLKFIIKKGGEQGPPRAQAERIIAGMVAALEFAHAKHIVHGDLKPGNVIVTESAEVKVIDFGIARFLRRPQDDGLHEEMPGEYIAFTPLYTSPETYDRAEPDARDDVYSLACIAHELLTGTHPFNRRPSIEARDKNMQVARSPRLRAHEHRAIQNALKFERAARTPSARRFLEELMGTRQRSVRQVAAIVAVAIAALVGMLFLGRLLVDAPASRDLTAGTVFRDCATCPLMVVLKPGTFEQGSSAGDTNATPFERPVHAVRIAYPLAAALTEVTVGEYAEFAKEHPRVADGCMTYAGEWALRASVDWRNAIPAQMATHPVSCVSFSDATEYAAWLSARTGATYRLPSASEWEYMARAGSDSLPWGDPAQACASANVADASAAQRYPGWIAFACEDNHVQSAPVGSFLPNAFGLSDTLGNVFEWVQDCWREDYVSAPTDGSAVTDGDCAQREARGGSWFTTPAFVRPAYRNRFDADYHSNSLGFRVVREIKDAK
ncbi:MAG TPA: bifunctional serine/threonine-protein kinase/formylglycine-generating enzyme family protein [Steroidobacteraceae bacterium]|nr:bifunctional serine/threonine-protein kinase/formylglycine-generating enzyme family protein [Steroidobacteraceae bacterium]